MRSAVAAATAVIALTGGVAHAQYYSPYYAAPVARSGYGPADPCAREAANRRLAWGVIGLIAGGIAGGAAAAADVVAEGAALGGFVGAITGGFVGGRSAACGTAALTGRPIYGETSSGVAIYGPSGGYGAVYDYGAAYGPPQPTAYPGGYYGAATVRRCCYEEPPPHPQAQPQGPSAGYSQGL
jgi:hypothetical protein